MKQRSALSVDTYHSRAIRLRRNDHCMGPARCVGVLVSWLLLACNHERVDLGGSGAGGSTVLLLAGRVSPQAWPEPPSPMLLTPPTRPAPSTQTTPVELHFAGLATLPRPVPPISGGTLAVAADGSVAVAADPDRDLVYVVELASEQVKTVALPAQSEPGRVVLDDQGHAHVVLRSAGKLARVTLVSAQLELSEPVCQHPRGLAYSADTQRVHVVCADGQLVQLSAATYEPLEREQHAVDLRDVLFTAHGQRVVSRFRQASLLLETGEITLPEQPWPAMNADAPNEPTGWVSTRAALGFRTVAAPDGTLWMLHEREQIDPLALDDHRGTHTHCGPAVQPALTQIDPQAGAVLRSLQLQGMAAPALDLAFSKYGHWLAIAAPAGYAQARPTVHLRQPHALERDALIDKQVNAEFPHSAVFMCIPPFFATLGSASQAVAVAFDDQDVLYTLHRFPAYLRSVQILHDPQTGDYPGLGAERHIELNDLPERDLGHELFHGALDASGVSCAACHADGNDDGHVWQTSKGARRTPSLRGGIAQTAPYAWDGQDASLEGVVERFAVGRSNAQVSAEALRSMGRWLDQLGAWTLQPSSEPELRAAASGKTLFESAALGCTDCHNGPHFTNNHTVDVGTGGALQVPSLLGLALRAPYMHDGCAADLQALFTTQACARDVHARLAALSGEEAASLQAYLRSL